MLYKPNFCCNCGEKIHRAEWKFFASRRFCEVCEIENKGHELLPKAIVAVGLLAGIFGLGSFVGGSGANRQMMPLKTETVDESRGFGVQQSQRSITEPSQPQITLPQVPPGSVAADLSKMSSGTATKEQPRPQTPASDEPVFYCGAMTKKGKPCSRRVKTRGRCWQHEGQPSALEPRQPADVY